MISSHIYTGNNKYVIKQNNKKQDKPIKPKPKNKIHYI
jgi:hypothetical protein